MPIVVNAGAAVLPAILAGAASFVGLLLKPRELMRACRRHPLVLLAVLALGGAVYLGIHVAATLPAQAKAPARFDWEAVAKARLNQQRATAMDLVTLWSYKATDQAGDTPPYFLSSPAVYKDRVFAATTLPDITGMTGAVVCVDAATGRQIWRTETSEDGTPLKPFFSSPTLTSDGKKVLIGQGLHTDANCALLCLDAATGKLLWRVKTTLHIESSPAVRGDLVVVGCGAIEGPDHKATTDPGHVIAVEISTGKLLWRYAVNDPESSPAIGEDGTVYIGSGFNGNAVVALRPQRDEELKAQGLERLIWKAPTPYPATGAVALAKDYVVIGCGNSDYVVRAAEPHGAVVILDRKTGREVHNVALPDAVLGSIAVRGEMLYAPCRSGHVYGLDTAGKVQWHADVASEAPVMAGVAASGPYLYAVTRDGYLAALEASTGRRIAKIYINDEAHPGDQGFCLSTPVVADGRLYVGSETGGLRCITGKQVAAGASPTARAEKSGAEASGAAAQAFSMMRSSQ